MTPNVPETKLEEIRQALFAGRKVAAIKLLRDATPLDLKGAKDAIDAWEQELRTKSPEKFTAPPSGGKGCMAMLVALLLAVAATAFFALR